MYVAVLVKPPPEPVIVIVYVPTGVELEVDMVMVLVNVGLPDDGLKLTVAPDGRPEAVKLTVAVEPLTSETVTVAVTLPPAVTLPLAGETDIEKSNGTLTVNVYDAVLDRPPPETVTVIVYVPAGVEGEVDIVMVEDAVVWLGLTVTLEGLKLAVAPEGKPEAERLTATEEL